jgi:hypothetical protein
LENTMSNLGRVRLHYITFQKLNINRNIHGPPIL